MQCLLYTQDSIRGIWNQTVAQYDNSTKNFTGKHYKKTKLETQNHRNAFEHTESL